MTHVYGLNAHYEPQNISEGTRRARGHKGLELKHGNKRDQPQGAEEWTEHTRRPKSGTGMERTHQNVPNTPDGACD